MKKSNWKRPKDLARAIWKILSNNPFNKVSYMVLLTSEVKSSNLDGYWSKPGVSLLYFGQIDNFFKILENQNYNNLWIGFSASILSINLLIIITVLIIASKRESHDQSTKPTFYFQVLSAVLVLYQTIFQMPFLDILLRALLTIPSIQEANTFEVFIKFTIALISLITFFMILLFAARLFNLNIPNELIPWCYPISKIVLLNVFFRILQVSSIVIDSEGKYSLYFLILLFLIKSFLAFYRLLFSPNYNLQVDFIVKSREFVVLLAYLIGFVCQIVKDDKNYDIIYIIIFAPCVTIGWKLFEQYRIKMILFKLKKQSLKLEIEFEYALYSLIQIIENSQGEGLQDQQVLGDLLDIAISHVEKCDDSLCICSELENFFDLMRYKGVDSSAEIIQLSLEERKKYKKIIDDQGLIGSISNMSEVVLKQNSTEQTQFQLLNEIDRLSKQQEEEDSKFSSQNQNQILGRQKTAGSQQTIDRLNFLRKQQSNKQKNITFKINIDETKLRYISELIYLFFIEIRAKFPDSLKIQLLCYYFTLRYLKKEMLCIFQMRTMNTKKLSFMNQISFHINEMYLLDEGKKVSQIKASNGKQFQLNFMTNFNGEYFIQINKLYKEFSFSIENLCIFMVRFWKEFDKKEFDLNFVRKLAKKIAKNIKETYRIFQKIEDIQILKDYQIYFQFAIIQLHIFNDQHHYELYINKMRSILETNKMFEKNSTPDPNSEFSNYMIVNANGYKFGDIIQMNQNLSSFLEIGSNAKEDSQTFGNIQDLMPQLIKQKHHLFLDRYKKTGQTLVINQKIVLFIRKQSGYVVPVELFVKFHYSVQYQYVFLALVKPIYEIAPFSNQVKYNSNQLIFMITDNEEGHIYEYSESCVQLLGFRKDFEVHEIRKSIDNALDDINFKKLIKDRRKRYLQNDIYEDIHTLNIEAFEEITALWDYETKAFDKLNRIHQLNNLQQDVNLDASLTDDLLKVRVKTRLFEERYCGGVLDLNIFCFMIMNEANTDQSNIFTLLNNQGVQEKIGYSSVYQIKNLTISPQNFTDFQNLALSDKKFNEKEQEKNELSHMDLQSIQSNASSTTSQVQLRHAFSMEQRTTPRSMKIMFQLVFILYLIMLIISSINLGINIARQKQSEQDINIVQLNYQRLSQVSKVQLYGRSLYQIANGINSNSTKLIDNRFDKFKEQQKKFIDELGVTQSKIQNSNFEKSKNLQKIYSEKNLKLYYLGPQNQVFEYNETIDLAFNLYLARLSEFNSYSKTDIRFPLPQLSMNKTVNNQISSTISYKPTPAEQTTYFVLQNGIKGFTYAAYQLLQQYVEDSSMHANSNIQITQVLTIVSCLTIITIGVIFAPMFSRAEIRDIKAVSFFLNLNNKLIPQLIKNCEYCLNMQDFKRNEQIQQDYEDVLGVQIRNQQIEQLKQARDQHINIVNQIKSYHGSTVIQSDYSGSMMIGKSSTFSLQIFSQGNLQNYNSSNSQKDIKANNDIITTLSNIKSKNSNILGLRISREEGGSINNIIDSSKTSNRKFRESNKSKAISQIYNQVNAQNINLNQDSQPTKKQAKLDGKNEKHSQSDSGSNSPYLSEENSNQMQNLEDLEQIAEFQRAQLEKQEKIDQEILTQKLKRVDQKIKRIILRLTLISLAVTVTLSSYFIISYFLALETFTTAADVNYTLASINQRQSCFQNTLNFYRETIIRMEMTPFYTQQLNESGVDFMFKNCYPLEQNYNKIRKYRPSYLDQAMTKIQKIESREFCDFVYQGDIQNLNSICKTASDGIFKQGFAIGMNYMYDWLFKNNLQVQQAIEQKNKQFLMTLLTDPHLLELIDLLTILLDPAYQILQEAARESVVLYIEKLLRNFMIAWAIFVSFLTLSVVLLVFIGFKKLRREMWNTNIILKVIPYEAMEKEERDKIINFFKY
eukprot:403351503